MTIYSSLCKVSVHTATYIKSGIGTLALCLLLFSCDPKQRESTSPANVSLAEQDIRSWVKADLECEEVRGADEEDPQAIVYLSQVESRHLIDTVYTCSVIAPEMYRNYDIPRHALSASGGWWAGRGNFYYTLQEGDSLVVMHAVREPQDSLDFQYSVRHRFPVLLPAE
jgi:hypothetical protein